MWLALQLGEPVVSQVELRRIERELPVEQPQEHLWPGLANHRPRLFLALVLFRWQVLRLVGLPMSLADFQGVLAVLSWMPCQSRWGWVYQEKS